MDRHVDITKWYITWGNYIFTYYFTKICVEWREICDFTKKNFFRKLTSLSHSENSEIIWFGKANIRPKSAQGKPRRARDSAYVLMLRMCVIYLR